MPKPYIPPPRPTLAAAAYAVLQRWQILTYLIHHKIPPTDKDYQAALYLPPHVLDVILDARIAEES